MVMAKQLHVMAEHGGNRAYAYRFPCGVITYKADRKHHNWVAVTAGGVRSSHGEDRVVALRVMGPGGHTELELR